MSKPLSKTAQLKLERQQRRQARIDRKNAEELRLEAARADARDACSKMPPDFQQWGIVRTRAFMNMAEILHYRSGLLTITADQLEAYTRHLRSVSTMPLEQCQELADVKTHERIGDFH